jgi:hypothetical protein
MNLSIQPVATQFVSQVWAEVEPFIKSAEDKSGAVEYNTEHIKVYLATGQWMLIVAADEEKKIHGAAAVNFINYPNDRVAFITAIGGKLIANEDTYAQMCALFKDCGATKIQGMARESVARLWKRFGFEERSILVETKI